MKTKETYYDVLGIAKDADTKEVKTAFRRLSKQLHPDVCKLPDAEERFNLAQQAYKTLLDKDMRKKYDTSLVRGENPWETDTFDTFDKAFNGFFNRPGTGVKPIDGLTFRHTLEYQVSDILNESEVTVQVEDRDRCVTCAATGKVPVKGTTTCKSCKGKGFTIHTKRDPVTGSYTVTRQCAECNGTGNVLHDPCPDCDGEKTVPITKDVTFTIPGDAHDGKILRVLSHGGIGLFGGRAGDLLVTLRRRKDDPAIVTDRGDVIYHVVLPPELFLKGKATIERFDGVHETCKIEPIPGTRHVLAGRGIGNGQGGRGDVVYLFYPDLPRKGS